MNKPALPEFPAPGERLAPSHPNADTLALLTRRRSTTAIALGELGPSPDEVEQLTDQPPPMLSEARSRSRWISSDASLI